jgi:hypothetical protein
VARSARLPRLPRLTSVAAVGLALAVAGCSPITTAEPYAASDGIRVELGEQVRGQNLMILTRAAGEPGVLLGGLVNDGETATDVTVTIGSETVLLAIDAGQTVLLGAPGATSTSNLGVEEVAIASVPGAPGSFTDVRIETPESGSVTVGVPILDGTLESYEPVTPGSPAPVEATDDSETTGEAAGH